MSCVGLCNGNYILEKCVKQLHCLLLIHVGDCVMSYNIASYIWHSPLLRRFTNIVNYVTKKLTKKCKEKLESFQANRDHHHLKCKFHCWFSHADLLFIIQYGSTVY